MPRSSEPNWPDQDEPDDWLESTGPAELPEGALDEDEEEPEPEPGDFWIEPEEREDF